MGYLASVLLESREKGGCDRKRPRRSAVTNPFLKSLFSAPVLAVETEEEAEAQVDSPEQERATLAALLFADDNSLPENVKSEIRSKTKPHNAPQPHDPQINTRQTNHGQTNDHPIY